MNFTGSCLLDLVRHCDLRAGALRIQIDGASDNLNYGVMSLCGLLVMHGLFREVVLCRLPVG